VSDTVIALTIRVPYPDVYVNSNSYLQEVLKSSCLYVLKDVLSSNSLDTVTERLLYSPPLLAPSFDRMMPKGTT